MDLQIDSVSAKPFTFLRASLSWDDGNKPDFKMIRVITFEVTYQRRYLLFFKKTDTTYAFFDKVRGWELSKMIRSEEIRQPLLEALNQYLPASKIEVE